jgi:hypothetical protein
LTKFLLCVHILAVIVAIGPVAVAASMFPAAARRAGHEPAVVHTLHRICRVYAGVGVVVPVFGLATASRLQVLGDTWLIVSIVLTVIAATVLTVLVLPRQKMILAQPAQGATAQLAIHTGLFNLLWATVTVLMIIRPGSTTGV